MSNSTLMSMYVTGIILYMKGASEEYHPEAITEREEWKESTLQKAVNTYCSIK